MTINLTLPTCWQELTPKQLRYVYFLLSQNYTADDTEIKSGFCRHHFRLIFRQLILHYITFT
ncbi:MAG: hypothetical protein K5660_04250 [Paludibacteraceae bacterium]|nr:hypothetical protein [Paludibacteraceae bacterium]